jgi:acylphosphatase
MHWWPPDFMKEAQVEGYVYFDKTIRRLPKNPDGTVNIYASGLADNDVDAFRHAYVSGVFTQEYGEQVAKILGWMNE